jgi:hypothetical protein
MTALIRGKCWQEEVRFPSPTNVNRPPARPVAGTEGKSEDWADVPMVGDGYRAARDAIRRHISRLIDELTTRAL